jgi:hypothetical protein
VGDAIIVAKCNRANVDPVAFYPPDLIACFIPQPLPENIQTIVAVREKLSVGIFAQSAQLDRQQRRAAFEANIDRSASARGIANTALSLACCLARGS